MWRRSVKLKFVEAPAKRQMLFVHGAQLSASKQAQKAISYVKANCEIEKLAQGIAAHASAASDFVTPD